MDNNKTFGFGIAGFIIGAFLAFLMRPSTFLGGQLPLEDVISRGANLKGMDIMLVPLAHQSFNVMLSGAIIGALAGLAVGYFAGKKNK